MRNIAHRLLRSQYLAVALVAGIGAACSCVMFLMVLSWEHRATEADFARKASAFLAVINTELSNSGTLLYTVGAYVETNDHPVNREQFGRFAKILHERVVGLRNVGWAPRVNAAQRRSFETGGFPGVEGTHGYLIFERDPHRGNVRDRPRSSYYPILFLETALDNPDAEVRRVRGYDLTSEAARAAAIRQAIRTGRPAATPPIRLLTVRGHNGGVIAFMPVGQTRGSRRGRSNPTGVAFEVFDIALMLESIIAQESPANDLNLAIYNPTGPNGNRLIYWQPARTGNVGDAHPPSEADLRTTLHWHGTLAMIDQRWGAMITPTTPVRWIDESRQAILTLAVGLTMTAMIVVHLIISLRRTSILERVATNLRDTTEELRRTLGQVAYLAHHDSLTGLANRVLFRECIDAALARAARDAFGSLLSRSRLVQTRQRYLGTRCW